jgi:protein AATF/BFR2
MRKDKIKKIVDTKASKGRKMRYNVHEKLQNFMAPEDRGTWSIKAREEFFASLLGKTASRLLGEDNEEERMNGATSEDSEVEKEECLRLFGSS